MQRRDFFSGLVALAATLWARGSEARIVRQLSGDAVVRFNMSSFRPRFREDHFAGHRGAVILVDVDSRAVHFWGADGATYRVYPCSVPMTEEQTRRGRTSVIQKVTAPVWRPTPEMRRRHPEWPTEVPPGPMNPLGPYALYLGWEAFRIHGTHDPAKIGRMASSGCFGLLNRDITELFGLVPVGTEVLVI